MFRSGRLLGPIVVVLALVAGCGSAGSGPVAGGGSSAAPVTASVSVSPSVSGAAQVVRPVLPAEASRPTRAGAEAFFRYFWDVYNYTFAARDTALLTSVSDSGCTFCTSTVDAVEKGRSRDLRFVGGKVTVDACVAASGDPAEGILVNGTITQSESVTMDSAGAVLARDPAAQGKAVDAVTAYENGRWVVLAIDRRPKR